MPERAFVIFILSVAPTLAAVVSSSSAAYAAQLEAGVAKVEITDRAAGPVNDPSFVKVLLMKSGDTPTTPQRLNPGFAQEDCDSLVAPVWQPIFEKKALEILAALK